MTNYSSSSTLLTFLTKRAFFLVLVVILVFFSVGRLSNFDPEGVSPSSLYSGLGRLPSFVGGGASLNSLRNGNNGDVDVGGGDGRNINKQQHQSSDDKDEEGVDEQSTESLKDESSLYRLHLEKTTSPASFAHSPTLTFDKIYVISLRKRQDRRQRMEKLARALALEFMFVDAIEKTANVVGWIGERVAEVRNKKVDVLVNARRGVRGAIGGSGIGSVWLDGASDETLAWPSLDDDARWNGKDWVSFLFHEKIETLKPKPDFDLQLTLRDPLIKDDTRQMNPGIIATYLSHFRVWKSIIESGDKTALILEDDVDIEWDIERRWASIERRLPTNWDTVHLGHCWGRESEQPAYLHPHLHLSTQPKCLHAYAISDAGARKVISALSDPWKAFQGAIDNALPTLIAERAITAFSIEPSLVIQRKEFSSDILDGSGSTWKGVLADSTIDRILIDEGEIVENSIYDPRRPDPATLYRLGRPPQLEADKAEKYRKPVPFAKSKPQLGGGKVGGSGGGRQQQQQHNKPKFDFKAGEKQEETQLDRPEDAPLAARPAVHDAQHLQHPPQAADSSNLEVDQQPAADLSAPNPPDGNANAPPPPPGHANAPHPKVGTGGRVHAAGMGGGLKDKEDASNVVAIPANPAAAKEAGRRVGTGARPNAKGLAGVHIPDVVKQ